MITDFLGAEKYFIANLSRKRRVVAVRWILWNWVTGKKSWLVRSVAHWIRTDSIDSVFPFDVEMLRGYTHIGDEIRY